MKLWPGIVKKGILAKEALPNGQLFPSEQSEENEDEEPGVANPTKAPAQEKGECLNRKVWKTLAAEIGEDDENDEKDVRDGSRLHVKSLEAARDDEGDSGSEEDRPKRHEIRERFGSSSKPFANWRKNSDRQAAYSI